MLHDDCLACDVLSGKVEAPGGVIFEATHWVVDRQVSPASLRGFLIVKPKRHCEHIGELDSSEASELGDVLKKTCHAVQQGLLAEKVYVLSFGEAVKHIHFYVIPRYAGMPESGRLVMDGLREGKWQCIDEEASTAAEAVRRIFPKS